MVRRQLSDDECWRTRANGSRSDLNRGGYHAASLRLGVDRSRYGQYVLKLVPLLPECREAILEWRNSASVSPFMYRDTPIGSAEHASWFAAAMNDAGDRIHRLLTIDGEPSGVMSLSDINASAGSAEWGGYLAPHVPRGLGHGRAFLEASCELARNDFGIRAIQVEVLETNSAARHLYESVGFEYVERIEHRVVRDGNPVAAYRLTRSLDR
jgi:UDP-4-amino-4,6-dideoxy-N-acetyl-beta-L-altrosamine N-acetyltransferase